MNIQCKIISIFLYTKYFSKNCPTAVLSTQNNSVPIFFSEVSEELKMKYETWEISDV